MKSFSPAGAATKAYYGRGARTFGNPGGASQGGGAFGGGSNQNGANQGGGPLPGLSFTSRGQVSALSTFYNVGYGNGVFVMSDGATHLYRSADNGQTWALNAHVLPFNTVGNAYGAGVWITAGGVTLVGSNGAEARSLDDAVTWTDSTPFAANTSTAAFATSGATWCALRTEAGQTSRVRTSTDGGVTWPNLSAFQNRAWLNNDIIWDGTQFVALGQQSVTSLPTVNTSGDGLTWVETVLDPAGVNSFVGIAFDSVSGKYLVGLTSSNAVRVASTPAGLATAPNKSTGLSDGGNVWSFAAGGKFFAFGSKGNLATSTDAGVTWATGATHFTPANSVVRSAAYSPVSAVVVIVGDNGNVATYP